MEWVGGAGSGVGGASPRSGRGPCRPALTAVLPSPGRYSLEAQSLDHRCSCCKEERTSQREVELQCPTGGSIKHTYTHIESCLCQDTSCEPRRAQRHAPHPARRSSPRGPRGSLE